MYRMDCSQPVCPLLYRMSAALTRKDRALLCLPVSMEMRPKKCFLTPLKTRPTDSNSQRSAAKKKKKKKRNEIKRAQTFIRESHFLPLSCTSQFSGQGGCGVKKKKKKMPSSSAAQVNN